METSEQPTTTVTSPAPGFRLDVFSTRTGKSFTFSLFRTATGTQAQHRGKFSSADSATRAGEKLANTWSRNLLARGVDPTSEDE